MDKRPESLKRITTKKAAEKFINSQIKEIQAQVGDKKVLLALSGGVDSSVVAALLIKAIGRQLVCVHVNHGLLRKGEPEQVIEVFEKNLGADLRYVDASNKFLKELKGVDDPETNILESKGVKAHHNVGGLPKELNFELVEPVKYLYKDEVRVVGEALGLPKDMVYRQPFPGPGLGVRCVGAITKDRLNALREADAIVREEIGKLKEKPWQYFCVIPDLKSTGIKDGKRYMGWAAIIRAINTKDAVTAKSYEIPYKTLYKIRDRIIKEVPGINRVLWDYSDKPVSTIEWE